MACRRPSAGFSRVSNAQCRTTRHQSVPWIPLRPQPVTKSFVANATTTTTGCSGSRLSSTTIASGRIVSVASGPKPPAWTSSATCCRCSMTSSARSRHRSTRTANASVREGIELIHRQLLDVVRRRGVEPFDVVGPDLRSGVARGRRQRARPWPAGRRDHRRSAARLSRRSTTGARARWSRWPRRELAGTTTKSSASSGARTSRKSRAPTASRP